MNHPSIILPVLGQSLMLFVQEFELAIAERLQALFCYFLCLFSLKPPFIHLLIIKETFIHY